MFCISLQHPSIFFIIFNNINISHSNIIFSSISIIFINNNNNNNNFYIFIFIFIFISSFFIF